MQVHFFQQRFVSFENKGLKIQLPKLVLRVRASSPAPDLLSKNAKSDRQTGQNQELIATLKPRSGDVDDDCKANPGDMIAQEPKPEQRELRH